MKVNLRTSKRRPIYWSSTANNQDAKRQRQPKILRPQSALQFMRTCIIVFLLIGLSGLNAQLSDSISLAAIERIDLHEASAATFQEYLDLGTKLVDEPGEAGFKGELILTIASEALKTAIKTNRLDPGTPKVAMLLKGFAARGYLVYQPKVPDLVKGLRYCCEGKYGYVLTRLKQRGYLYPLSGLAMLLIGLLLARWFNWINWGNRQMILRWAIGLMVAMTVLFVLFKYSCDSAITPTSIYGVPVR